MTRWGYARPWGRRKLQGSEASSSARVLDVCVPYEPFSGRQPGGVEREPAPGGHTTPLFLSPIMAQLKAIVQGRR